MRKIRQFCSRCWLRRVIRFEYVSINESYKFCTNCSLSLINRLAVVGKPMFPRTPLEAIKAHVRKNSGRR